MSTETVWNRRLACAGARCSSNAMWREIKAAALELKLNAPTQCVTTQAIGRMSTYELQ